MSFSYCAKITLGSVTLLSGLLLSCQANRIETPDSELYARKFIKEFGVVDPNATWNSAKQVNMQIGQSALSGADKVEVLTGWPGAKDSRLLANYDAKEATNFLLDVPEGSRHLFVRVLDANKSVISSHYTEINNGMATYEAANSQAEVVTSHLFDLTNSPAFGGIKVTDDNNADGFWSNFKCKNGELAYNPNVEVPTLNYTEYTKASIKLNPNKSDELNDLVDFPTEGVEFNHWDKCVRVLKFKDYTPAIVSNRIAIKVYGSQNGNGTDCQIQLAHGGAGDWTQFDNKIISTQDFEVEFVLDTDADVNQIVENGARIQGSWITIKGVEFKELEPDMSRLNSNSVKYADMFDLYGFTTQKVDSYSGYISNVVGPDNSKDTQGYSASDLVPLVGSNGAFHEDINSNGMCNYEYYKDEFNIEDGVVYTLSKDQTVSIDFFFGIASFFNQLGYFYWEGDLSDEDLLKLPKFVLIGNAYPGHNIMYETNNGWEHIAPYNSLDKAGYGKAHEGYINAALDEGKDKSMDWYQPSLPKYFIEIAEEGKEKFVVGSDRDATARSAALNNYTGRMRSANYRLVHYDIDSDGKPIEGTASYEFKEGTKIAFFTVQGGYYWIDKNGNTPQAVNHRRLSFSMPSLNKRIGNTIHAGHTHTKQGEADSKMHNGNGSLEPWASFVTYRYNGNIIMGVEDWSCEQEGSFDDVTYYTGGDHDMNDLLFQINATVSEKIEEVPVETSKMSWIIACEDLGATDDFDFNDVVFGVTHVKGEETATVTALASGGTMPVYLYAPKFDDNGNVVGEEASPIAPDNSNGGEFHSWWGANRPSSSPINVTGYEGIGASVSISVPKEWTLSPVDNHKYAEGGNMGGFKVKVKREDGTTTNEIKAPDAKGDIAPQMFLVPSEWWWCRERQHILEVYKRFAAPTNSDSNGDEGWWRNQEVHENHHGKIIKHDWSVK